MKTCALLALLIFLPIVTSFRSIANEGQGSNEKLVREFVAAYNDRKLDTMLNMVTDDVEWLSVAGSRISVESAGKDDLRKCMEGYFRSTPSARSELVWVEETPTRVAALEKAKWHARSGEESQVSLAVYEFRGRLISRVYYYPAEK